MVKRRAAENRAQIRRQTAMALRGYSDEERKICVMQNAVRRFLVLVRHKRLDDPLDAYS